MHLDGRRGTDLRVKSRRGRLKATIIQAQRVAVRIEVIRKDIDGHHTVGASENRVGHGHRILIQRRNRRHSDAHASRRARPLTILNRVREGVSARRIVIRGVLNPRCLRGRRTLLR